jgi:hypothetical protein
MDLRGPDGVDCLAALFAARHEFLAGAEKEESGKNSTDMKKGPTSTLSVR